MTTLIICIFPRTTRLGESVGVHGGWRWGTGRADECGGSLCRASDAKTGPAAGGASQ